MSYCEESPNSKHCPEMIYVDTQDEDSSSLSSDCVFCGTKMFILTLLHSSWAIEANEDDDDEYDDDEEEEE